MRYIIKYKVEFVLVFFFLLLYAFTRLFHILNFPIFTDEAIYARWAQIAFHDPNWRFISLTDGKQPMFVWFAMVAMKLIKDPLLASRIVSVGTGFMTSWGIFFLTKELFKSKWIALIAVFTYLIYPFALVYDRMALYESTVNMFTVWSLYVSILLVRRITLGIAMILGLILGGSVLTKGSAFASALFLPFTLLLFNVKQKYLKKRFLQWVWYACISSGLAFLYYSILRLSPFFHIIAEKTAFFVYPINEWIHHPFTFFFNNISAQLNWLYLYMTLPWLILAIASFFISKEFIKEKIILLLWFLISFITLALIGRTIYPRFILYMTISLLPLVAYTLFFLKKFIPNKLLYTAVFFIFISLPLYSDYKILTDFGHAPIPVEDLDQYYNNWPAGGGVSEATIFFQQQAQNKHIYIGTEGTFGLMPYAFELYLVENPNVTLKGFWPIPDTIPQELIQAAKRMPTYVVFYQPCPSCTLPGDAPITWPLTKIASYKKGNGLLSLTIYRVHP